MITWAHACEAVGYTYTVRVNAPNRVSVYYAYKDGVVKAFDTKEEAKVYSKNVEPGYTEVSSIAYKTFMDKMLHLEQDATEYWCAALRKEHNDLTDNVFNRCYAMAYDGGNSGGMDEVAKYMEDCVIFAKAIIAEAKGS